MHGLYIQAALAYIGSWFDALGITSPGARTPKKPKSTPQRHRYYCGCVRYPSPVDGTLIEDNCGQYVYFKGLVLVSLGHEGADDYDHEAILQVIRTKQRAARAKRLAKDAALTVSLYEEAMASTLDTSMGNPTSLESILAEIMLTHADVLDACNKYSLYCGISKQTSARSKTIRGEPGRFLHQSSQTVGSSNVPILQWNFTWYGRTALNRGDLDWWDFETRIIYTTRSKRDAALVEKSIQGARVKVIVVTVSSNLHSLCCPHLDTRTCCPSFPVSPRRAPMSRTCRRSRQPRLQGEQV